jgi:glucuronate isomerase
LRNPLYHWTHLELQRYFGIEELLSERTAPAIWEAANARLASSDSSVHGILRRMKVELVCTTDDPTDTLEEHRALRSSGLPTRIYPAFRPDRALAIDQPVEWHAWRRRLEKVSGADTSTFEGFLAALRQRHGFFHENGCRLSDHGLSFCPAIYGTEAGAARIFDGVVYGNTASPAEVEEFGTFLMVFFGRMDHERGWV